MKELLKDIRDVLIGILIISLLPLIVVLIIIGHIIEFIIDVVKFIGNNLKYFKHGKLTRVFKRWIG